MFKSDDGFIVYHVMSQMFALFVQIGDNVVFLSINNSSIRLNYHQARLFLVTLLNTSLYIFLLILFIY